MLFLIVIVLVRIRVNLKNVIVILVFEVLTPHEFIGLKIFIANVIQLKLDIA